MEKYSLLNRIKELYENNTNIIKYLKTLNSQTSNTTEDILISYDFQAGTYIKKHESDPSFLNRYCSSIGNIINNLGNFNSIIEIGVGEATTLSTLLIYLESRPNQILGFDISWSRIKYAKDYLESQGINDAILFTGDLFSSPLKDNSIDVVYTSHSIEPNGGKEEEALKELYRITNKYLILLEPSYEFASQEGKERMESNGYVKNLYSTAIKLGYNVIEHRLLDICSNPLNPTELIIIEKKGSDIENLSPLCCPITKTDLKYQNDCYYSQDSLLAYPLIKDIPCLLPQNAIVATKLMD